MSTKACAARTSTYRALTKSEIDRRIDALAGQLAAAVDNPAGNAAREARPRWISASELVRRMRPFIVLN